MIRPQQVTLLALGFLVVLVVVVGAPKGEARTSLGGMAGLTHSTFNGDTPERGKYGSIAGFAFGGICEIDITPSVKVSLQPSLVRKGTKIAYEVKGLKDRLDSVDIRIDYLTVPVLFKVMTGGGRFYVSGGLELGFPLQAKREVSSGKTDIDEDLADLDLAADFGIGLHIPVGRPVMFMELRYTQSILDIIDEQRADRRLGLQPRVKNSGTQFYLGVLYRL